MSNIIALNTDYKIRFYEEKGEYNGNLKEFTIKEQSEIENVWVIDKDGHKHEVCYSYDYDTGLVRIMPGICVGIDVITSLPENDTIYLNDILVNNITDDLEPHLFFSASLKNKFIYYYSIPSVNLTQITSQPLKKVGSSVFSNQSFTLSAGNIYLLMGFKRNGRQFISHIVAIFVYDNVTFNNNNLIWSNEQFISTDKDKIYFLEIFGKYDSKLDYYLYQYSNNPFLISTDEEIIRFDFISPRNKIFEQNKSITRLNFLSPRILRLLLIRKRIESPSSCLIYGTNDLKNFSLFNYRIYDYQEIGQSIEQIGKILMPVVIMEYDYKNMCFLENKTIENNKTKFDIIPNYNIIQKIPFDDQYLLDLPTFHTHLVKELNILTYKLKGRVYIKYKSTYDYPDIQNKSSLLLNQNLEPSYEISDVVNNFLFSTNYQTPILLTTNDFKNDILSQKANNNYSILFISDKFNYKQFEEINDLIENSSFYIKALVTNKNVKYPNQVIDDEWIDTQNEIIQQNQDYDLLTISLVPTPPFVSYNYAILNGNLLYIVFQNDISDFFKYDYILYFDNHRYYVFRQLTQTKTPLNKKTIIGIMEKVKYYRFGNFPFLPPFKFASLKRKKYNELDTNEDIYAKRINNDSEDLFIRSITLGISFPYISFYEPLVIDVDGSEKSVLYFLLHKSKKIQQYFNNPFLRFPIIFEDHPYKSYYYEKYSISHNKIYEFKKQGLNLVTANYEIDPITSYASTDYNALQSNQQIILQVVFVAQQELKFLSKITRKLFDEIVLKNTLKKIKNICGKKGIDVDFKYEFDANELKVNITADVKVNQTVRKVSFTVTF